MTEIYLGTVLLEKNRWTTLREPSLLISEWIPKIEKAGFNGIELWENHALISTPEEMKNLLEYKEFIKIYNTYCGFSDEERSQREKAIENIVKFGCKRLKFNLGRDITKIDEYTANLKEWIDRLPADCELLCECHGGSILEEPERAYEILGQVNSNKIGIIIHGIHDIAFVDRWLKLFGSKVSHIHLRRDETQEILAKKINNVYQKGFTGSFTIEFTEGIETENESPQLLLSNAIEDLQFLRGIIR